MLSFLHQPWPWYVAGPLIGLMVPILLLTGNKRLGISSSLRHICAACLPAKIPFFQYNWRKEIWNLFFVSGIILGGYIAVTLFASPNQVVVNEKLLSSLVANGITDHSKLIPVDIFNWSALLTVRGLLFMVLGGFLVGFGTRYSGGCTSGHSIMGISNLQLSSLVATCCFMAGGFIMTNCLIPFILKLS